MRLLGKNARFRIIAGLLLLAYGSAGVLGYGLHAVWDCGDHCHAHAHAEGLAHAHPHAADPHDHGHECHHPHDHAAEVAQSEEQHDSWKSAADDCPICEFLVQAQTPYLIEFATAEVGPAAVHYVFHDASYVAPLSGIHAARGPPLA